MNITILANRDLASCIALNRLVPALADHELSLFLSASVGGKPGLPQQLQALKFFEQDLFNALLFPALDNAELPAQGRLKTFQGLAELAGTECSELNQINVGEDFERFVSTAPELVISIRYGIILRERVIAVPRFGVINLHSGLLPAYKGVMATFRAMLNGDTEIGMTLHYIDDPTIDTGRIIDKTALEVEAGRSYLWHVLELYDEGCASLLRAIEVLASGAQLQCMEQAAGGNYYSFPSAAELAAFEAKSLQLVDSAEVLELARQFLG